MTFSVVPDAAHPEIHNDGLRYEGLRFRAECRLAGKIYGQPFGIDVALGEPLLGNAEELTVEDVLAFAGIAPPRVRLYPVETHVAEKLHAYTMPRARPNSRIKDLPDLALLSTVRENDAERLRAALDQTFAFRKTHPLPAAVPPPPTSWTRPYAAMAQENHLEWTTLEALAGAVQGFLDPILAGEPDAVWEPLQRRWRPGGALKSAEAGPT